MRPIAWLAAAAAGLSCTLGSAVAAHADPALAQLEVLYAFDAQAFVGSVFQASDGNFYGTTVNGPGAVFRINRDTRVFAVLHDFDPTGALGRSPSSLIQASDGNLYGTTYHGGAADCGTVFRLTLSGAYTVFHEFPCGLVGRGVHFSSSKATTARSTVCSGRASSVRHTSSRPWSMG